jgi:hypothetical protein
MPALRLGVARVEITPEYPVELAGFAARRGVFTAVAHPLYARVLAFEQEVPDGGTRAALLVVADLIWWGSERVPALRRRVRDRWGIDEAAIVFHGSHSHSGPQTSARFAPSLGAPDEGYVAWLEERVLAAIGRALDDLTPVAIERGRGACRIGINRRVRRGDAVVIDGNPEGPIDRELVVFRCRAADGATKALLVHFACHPVINADNVVSAEYPGVAMARLEEGLDGGVAAFLQGCCGDINPALLYEGGTGGEPRRRGKAGVRQVAGELVTAVGRVLDGPLDAIPPGAITSRRVVVPLPLRALPTREELQALVAAPGVAGEWSGLLLARPEPLGAEIPCELTLVGLADGLALLALDAEVAVAYGLFVKELSAGRVLPLPYSNGMLGYIVTAAQLAEGGYEADESTRYFGLPAPFAPALEARLKGVIAGLLRDAGLLAAQAPLPHPGGTARPALRSGPRPRPG